jgi:hypothetical protein
MPPAWLGTLAPAQRSPFGFPSPTSSYWTDETRAAVAARYPGFDPRPYRGGDPPPPRVLDPAVMAAGAGRAGPTAAECAAFEAEGFVGVDGVLPEALLLAAAAQSAAQGGSAGEWAASFPFSAAELPALNELTLHPQLLAACAALLGSTDLQLVRSELRIRKAGEAPAEALHQNFLAQSLVVPPQPPAEQEAVCLVVALSPGDQELRPWKPAEEAAARSVPYHTGLVLFYRMVRARPSRGRGGRGSRSPCGAILPLLANTHAQ